MSFHDFGPNDSEMKAAQKLPSRYFVAVICTLLIHDCKIFVQLIVSIECRRSSFSLQLFNENSLFQLWWNLHNKLNAKIPWISGLPWFPSVFCNAKSGDSSLSNLKREVCSKPRYPIPAAIILHGGILITLLAETLHILTHYGTWAL